MFTKDFASGRTRTYMEQASFEMSKLGSPIGNSTEISPALRQRGAAANASSSRMDQNDEDGMSVSGRRLTVPVHPHYYSTGSSFEDVLNGWFFGLIRERRRYALTCSIVGSALTFLGLNFLLHLSIWSPIASVSDAFFSMFSLKSFAQLAFYSMCSGALSWTWSYLMLKVDGNNHLSKYNVINWVVFLAVCTIELVANLILWGTLFSDVVATEEEVLSAYVFLVLIVMKIAYGHVFSNTFRITQPLKEVNVKSDLMAMFEIRSDAMYRDSVIGSLRAFKTAIWVYVPLTFVFPISIWKLMNLPLLFAYLMLAFRQLIGFAVSYRSNRIFLAQHIEFTMPSTYALKDATDEEKRNIVNGLESTILPIKVFAFWDLRKLSLNESARRLSLYSLSQPGGHPRNWNSVKDACVNAIRSASEKVEDENRNIRLNDIAELSEKVVLDPNAVKDGNLEIDRTAMMMPPELRLQMHRDNVRMRYEHSLSSRRFHVIRKIPAVAKAEKIIGQIWDYVVDNNKRVTDYEADQAMYAIESIRALVQYSYSEDRYGVVQKDLNELFSSLLVLQVAADTNIRSKHLRSASAPVSDYVRNFNSGIIKLEQAATYAISRLVVIFKDHLHTLKLSENHMELLNTFSQQSQSQ